MPRHQKIARTQQSLLGTVSDSDLVRFGKISEALQNTHAKTSRTQIQGSTQKDAQLLGLTLRLPTSEGDRDLEWDICEPNILLAHVVASCPDLQAAYAVAAQRVPPTRERPWDLMVCFDEFSPGDKLNYDNTRKAMVLSFNFKQLGDHVLQRDYSWMVPIVVRTSKIKRVLGGWSNMLRRFFLIMLLGTHGGATAGITITIHDRPLTIYYRVKCLGSDYDGIRMGFDWKGATSIRCCLRCSNVFKRGSGLAHRVENGVESTCVDKTKLIERTNEDFENDVDLVTEAGDQWARGLITKTIKEDIEKSTAQNFNPLGLFACKELRPHIRALVCLNQDWVHGILQSGTMVVEIQNFLLELGCAREAGYNIRWLYLLRCDVKNIRLKLY
jgi:hypothetical protein